MTTPKVRLQKWGYEVVFATYMIIRAVVCSLYPVFTLYFTFQKTASFSDAKMREYIVQHLLAGHISDNRANSTQTSPQIFTENVGRNIH